MYVSCCAHSLLGFPDCSHTTVIGQVTHHVPELQFCCCGVVWTKHHLQLQLPTPQHPQTTHPPDSDSYSRQNVCFRGLQGTPFFRISARIAVSLLSGLRKLDANCPLAKQNLYELLGTFAFAHSLASKSPPKLRLPLRESRPKSSIANLKPRI